MVSSFYDADTLRLTDIRQYKEAVNIITDAFPRIHSLVIGPGLGRDHHVLNVLALVVKKAIDSNIPFVIDADGLFLICQNLNLIKNYEKCILTPNKVEFQRLVLAAMTQLTSLSDPSNITGNLNMNELYIYNNLQSNNTSLQLQALCQYLGSVTILLKGKFNEIFYCSLHKNT